MPRPFTLTHCTALGIALLAADAGAQLAIDADLQEPVAPHPVIMEVLYDIPARELGGDANLDATRSIVGDEFVEIMNPHDKPIDLTGYRIEDGMVQEQHRLIFTFPEFTLPPGEVVVVFNGARADEIPGDDGSPSRAPAIRNPHFGDGWVFSMRQQTAHKAYDNKGDVIFLTAPDGSHVDAVWWGAPPQRPPTSGRVEKTPLNPGQSMQRLTPTGRMARHTEIDGELYSPGRVPTTHTDADAGNDAKDEHTGE